MNEIVQKLFKINGRHYNDYMPVGLKIHQKLWWYLVPGTTIKVRWPRGEVKVGPSHREGWSGVGEYFEYVHSADPNDFYREELERLVGRQGIHWDWGLSGNDAADDCLTIKICRGKDKWAAYFLLKWAS
jgi:hypothetical protein